MIETEILDGCVAEAHEARLARLFDAHYGRLFRLARRLSNGSDEAQDLVQETFVRLARSRRIPEGDPHEEAWLVRVLVNLSRDRWRRARVRAGEPRTEAVASPDPEPAYAAKIVVQRALLALPPRRRAVVVMREFEDVDVATIACLLGVSAVTVRWHLSRARKQLARFLGAHER